MRVTRVRRSASLLLLIWCGALPRVAAQTAMPALYSVAFTHSERELIGDLIAGPRGERSRESSVAISSWNSERVRTRYGAWGPPARHYPATPEFDAKPVEWRRERLIATAMRFEGYGYQHHHIPDWEPPADWPWKPTAMGRNGKGVDCSNFTALAYNLAFGLSTTSDVDQQAERVRFTREGNGPAVEARRIEIPTSYDELARTLKSGDLLFIKNRQGNISHVVLWVGSISRAVDGNPLVLDSHGEDVKDANGTPIPAGVHLQPFRRNSWYFRSASHALRVLRD